MGLSGSSVKPISITTDSPPPECPMHKNTPSFSSATTVAGECPASFGTDQLVTSETDVDPKNMVSTCHYLICQGFIWVLFSAALFCQVSHMISE